MGRSQAAINKDWEQEQQRVDLCAHARAYIRKGWAVVPLWWPSFPLVCACPAGGDCKSVGKHPHTKHGTRAPLRSGLDVDLYWQRHPLCNVGIATGAASGFVVLDIDPGKGGRTSMNTIWKRYGRPGDTLVSVTGGGGRHVLFKYPGDKVKNANAYMPGIDVRGDGGLIVAPPSMHGSGERYSWHPDGHPRDKALAPMPEWMFTAMVADEQQKRDHNARRTRRVDRQSRYGRTLDPDLVPAVAEGERNTTLCSIAGRLIWENRDEDEVLAMVQGLNETKCQPPLPDGEVTRLVMHAYRRWAGR